MKYTGAAVILGAGASKGAHLKGGETPPLDFEFLASAEKYFSGRRASGKNKEMVDEWHSLQDGLKSTKLRFGDIRDWRLEQLSTYLEARANLSGLQLYQGKPKAHEKALESLKRIIAFVLRAKGGTEPCTLHQGLFELVQPSVVISFNYDIIADQTLLKMDALNWTKKQYRGQITSHILKVSGEGLTPHRIETMPWHDKIPLLKLHGSMHWESSKKGDGYCLSGVRLPAGDSGFDVVEIPEKPYIVPPIAAKFSIHEGALRDHWQEAVGYLAKAKSWIIWGYSFPPTDTTTQVLFHAALEKHRKAKKPVLVVNPDSTVSDRIEKICRKVTIQSSSSIESFLMAHGKLKL